MGLRMVAVRGVTETPTERREEWYGTSVQSVRAVQTETLRRGEEDGREAGEGAVARLACWR